MRPSVRFAAPRRRAPSSKAARKRPWPCPSTISGSARGATIQRFWAGSMSQSQLFTPLRVGALELKNRIVVAPMCQYSAIDGCMTDWHVIHLGHLALSGAALLTIEATAVQPAGRITYGDVGLYDEATERAMGQVLQSVRRWSDIPVANQLAHAG